MKRASLSRLAAALAKPGEAHDLAAAILQIEFDGAIDSQLPLKEPSASAAANRMRTLRANRKRTEGEQSEQNGEHVREQSEHGSPSLVLSPSPSSSASSEILNTSEEKERDCQVTEGRTRAANTVANISANTRTNTTHDRSFGMLVTAWADGIRSVTGTLYRPPGGKPGGELGDVLAEACKGAPNECERARELGAEYARANKGRTLTPFHFGDWLGSGKPERGSGVIRRGHQVQPVPADGPIWKEGT